MPDAACVESLIAEMLAAGSLPEGLFVPADHDLLEAFHALRRRGVEPQRDILLLGCNADPQFITRMHPRPATIDIQSEAVGRRAVEQLLWRVANREVAGRVETFIMPTVLESEGAAERSGR